MPGHSRSKNGVASLAYVPGIHDLPRMKKDVDGRNKSGHDDPWECRYSGSGLPLVSGRNGTTTKPSA